MSVAHEAQIVLRAKCERRHLLEWQDNESYKVTALLAAITGAQEGERVYYADDYLEFFDEGVFGILHLSQEQGGLTGVKVDPSALTSAIELLQSHFDAACVDTVVYASLEVDRY